MRHEAATGAHTAAAIKSAAEAALDAGLVDASDLPRLSRRLATIGHCELAGLLRVEADLEAAVAFGCGWLPGHDESNSSWLGWGLAVAACPDTAAGTLKWLSGADRWELRRAVASNPSFCRRFAC